MEKIGTPVAVDEVPSTTSTSTAAPQAQATNPYGQPQQQQQAQKPRPSQYLLWLSLLTIVATLLSILSKDYPHIRTSITSHPLDVLIEGGRSEFASHINPMSKNGTTNAVRVVFSLCTSWTRRAKFAQQVSTIKSMLSTTFSRREMYSPDPAVLIKGILYFEMSSQYCEETVLQYQQ